MTSHRPVLFATVGLAALVSTGGSSRFSARPLPDTKLRVVADYGRLPLHFEANDGQTDPQVRFMARGRGYGLFLTPTESILVLKQSKEATSPPAVVQMKLLDANPRPAVRGSERLPGRSHYLIGNDPKKWRTDVSQYARVEYEDVYPGVNLSYYGNQGQLEYDFVVAPGADPKQIRLGIEGADALRIDKDGNLVLSLPQGELVQRAPVVYQEIDGARRRVESRFALASARDVRFEVAEYEKDRDLIVDPVLDYSTYVGGSGDDSGWGIAVDASGNTYIAGYTDSIDFPTAAPIQPSNAGVNDAVVVKLSSSGALVYSTYLGGSGSDAAFGIAVDASDSAYVTGPTSSIDFPTVSPIQGSNGGGTDAFVAKLNATGSALLYSTYLGGSAYDDGRRIAVDLLGNGHIAGLTDSTNFPTANPIQPAKAGMYDAFLAKLNASGSTLVYSTYLGGISVDFPFGVTVDTSANVYVTGETGSLDFPTLNPFQAAYGGFGDAFVTKLSTMGSLVYSTYLGGADYDGGGGLAVDASGNAYVVGMTESNDFPTANPIQPARAGMGDTFVTKFNSSGAGLAYSTYLGGSSSDYAMGIAVDASGSVHITGYTESADFPLARSFRSCRIYEAFVVRLSTTGSNVVYSTCLGGSRNDYGQGIAVDTSGIAHIVGFASSTDFPTRHPIQDAHAGGIEDVFIARIGPGSPPPGDYDFDGQPDILWRDQNSTGHIAVWFMNGTTMTSSTLTTPSPFSLLNWRIVGTNDFNGDDKQDILWRDQDNAGYIAVWFMDGATMTSATLTDPDSFPLLNWEIVGTGDFNGDGKPDILWRETRSTGDIAVWFMDGTTRTGATLTDPPAFPLLNWAIVGTGDFNGDGKPDILWRETRSTGDIAVWFMDGTTRTGATLIDPPSFPLLNWQIVGTGDFNADGKTDILWRETRSTGHIAAWFMDGTTKTGATLTDPPAFPLLSWKIVGPR